ISDTRNGDMRFFERLSNHTDPCFGMNARRATQRIPIQWRCGFSAHRIDLQGRHFWMLQAVKGSITSFPVDHKERNFLFEQPEQHYLSDIRFSAASDRKDADMLDEILPPKIKRVE